MRYLLLFLLISPSLALAYDDMESQKILIKCLVSHQRKNHYPDSVSLTMSCQSEVQDFMRYNFPGTDPMACEGLAFQFAGGVLQKDCQNTPGCVPGR